MDNPISKISIRLPKPFPRHLKDGQVDTFLAVIRDPRDKAMFMLMLRCGLRVEEVARLTVDAVEYRKRQVFVVNGKGAKDRVVYLSDDARIALDAYMQKGRRRQGIVPRPEGASYRTRRYPSGASRRGSSTMAERADLTCRAIGLGIPSPRSF